jgi:hypothetical protein
MTAPRKDREVTVKMKTGGTYKFSYATMAAMVEADKPILAKHGLGFVQFVQDGCLVTRIIHESGEQMDCPLPMPNLPNAPQEAGSIITYFKRYSYSAAFGRVADEEDDANIAEGNGYTPRQQSTVSEEQLHKLQDKANAVGADLQRFCNYFGIGSLKDVPADKFNAAMTALDAKAKRQPEMAK